MAVIGDGKSATLHLPRTGPGGVFLGETGRVESALTVVLDSGVLAPLDGPPAVDHDARTLRILGVRRSEAPEVQPPAVQFEHTAERRDLRPPTQLYKDDSGQWRPLTRWSYAPGGEVQVEQHPAGQNTQVYFDRVLSYSGAEEEQGIATHTQAVNAYEFRWRFEFTPPALGASLPRGAYAGPGGTHTATAYRELQLDRWDTWREDPDAPQVPFSAERYVQGHVQGLRLAGAVGVGWVNWEYAASVEVTAVLGYDYHQTTGEVVATFVDCWWDIASFKEGGFAPPPPPGATPVRGIRQILAPGDGGAILYLEEVVHHVIRSVGQTSGFLRDRQVEAGEGTPPALPPHRFTAAAGQVTVDGPRTTSPASLTGATLTAFGHTFQGGTWAALRDLPETREDGTVDWDRVLVLHASDTTVTAVRQDGTARSLPRARFEEEVLRVAAGSFRAFSAVGTLNNTWPPQWAWCECGDETRAVTVHEVWRDSQKARPQEDAQPPPGPDHWYWPGRPARPPRALPASAPAAPLGLTLADVTGAVLHDEPLRRGEAPLRLPLAATVEGVDVLPRVAKRILYPPAEWPEELDDRTSAAGPLTLTFGLPDPPRPPAGEDPGEKWEAALVLRLKTRASVITVNGEGYPLLKLGHNAPARRGWHPYVVAVPVAATYTLEFPGQCSRALLCVRVMPAPGEAQEP